MDKIIKRKSGHNNPQRSFYATGIKKLILIVVGLLVSNILLFGEYSMIGPYLQSFDPTKEVIICWQRGVIEDNASVELGTDKNNLTSYQVTVTKMVDERYRYCSKISNLSPDTTYYYKISSEKEIFDFKTTADKDGFSFAVVGDTRTGISAHKSVIYEMTHNTFSFYLNTGDMAEHNRLYEWDTFFNIEKPIMKNHFFMPVVGNHDVGHNFPWDNKFYPQTLSGNGEYYSFWVQNNLFIVASTEIDFTPGSNQYTFITNQLKSAITADHIFIFYHKPGYSSGPHGLNTDEDMENVKKYLIPLEIQYNTTIVFNGHDHCYERSYNQGVYFLTTGGGGAPPSFIKSQDNPYSQFYNSNSDLDHFHFVLINVNKECVKTKAITTDGKIMDTLKIGNCPSEKEVKEEVTDTDNVISCNNYPVSNLLLLIFSLFFIIPFIKKNIIN